MFDILDIDLPGDVKPSPSTRARTVLENYNLDIDTYVKWMNTDVTATGSDDLIVSILIEMGQKMGYDLDRTVAEIYHRAFYLTPEISNTFGLTYSSTAGELHSGPSGNPTIYMAGPSIFREFATSITDYRDMVPIRYLSHDSTNLSVGSPALLEQGIGIGFDVIEIDLGLLMVQYMLWLKEQVDSEFDYKRSIMMFSAMHVWPKLIYTRLPLAFMNRARAIAQGLPVNNVQHNLSKNFVNRTGQAHAMLDEVVKFFGKRESTFQYLLGTLPVPGLFTLDRLVTLPDILINRQCAWAAIMARYNAFTYLYVLARVDPTRSRKFPVDNATRSITRAYNDRGFSQVMGLQEQRSVKTHMQTLLAFVGK